MSTKKPENPAVLVLVDRIAAEEARALEPTRRARRERARQIKDSDHARLITAARRRLGLERSTPPKTSRTKRAK